LNYIYALISYLDFTTKTQNWEAFDFELSKLAKLEEDNRLQVHLENIRAVAYPHIGLLELSAALKRNDAAFLSKAIAHWETRLTKPAFAIEPKAQLQLWLCMAVAKLQQNDWSGALKWINRVLNFKDQELRQDIQAFAKVLSLLLHIELGDFESVTFRLGGVKRYLEKRGTALKTSANLLKHIQTCLKNADEDPDEFRKLLLEKVKYMPEFNPPSEKVFNFDLVSWLKR
jgi:hypothetical protein